MNLHGNFWIAFGFIMYSRPHPVWPQSLKIFPWLRKDLSMKERGLKIRPVTWVFNPVSWMTWTKLELVNGHGKKTDKIEFQCEVVPRWYTLAHDHREQIHRMSQNQQLRIVCMENVMVPSLDWQSLAKAVPCAILPVDGELDVSTMWRWLHVKTCGNQSLWGL